ncbi:hypothetical protein GCM10009677_57650 [Sphaerisporangium rubeum]
MEGSSPAVRARRSGMGTWSWRRIREAVASFCVVRYVCVSRATLMFALTFMAVKESTSCHRAFTTSLLRLHREV